MLESVAEQWWLFLIRGIAAVLFGILAFLWPAITLRVLILLIAAYFVVDGIFSIIASFRERGRSDRWWIGLLEGIVGIIAGVAAFFWPGLSALVLVYIIGAWAVVTGVLEIIAAIEWRRHIENEWLLILGGLASVLFGLLVFFFPGGGALAIVWLIAAYAIIFGLLMIFLAFRLRGMRTTAAV